MVNDEDPISFTNEKMDTRTRRAQSIVGSSPGRPVNDWYPTPPEATLALLSREKFTGSIWEPACGDGAICRVLEQSGYSDVIASDLVNRGYGETPHDFLESSWKADNIITNPPFSLAQKFVEKSLAQTTGKVAMLCKLVFLEGQKRKSFFESTPLARVHVFSKRINFYREGQRGKLGTSMMCFAWFVWEHGYEGQPTISWL